MPMYVAITNSLKVLVGLVVKAEDSKLKRHRFVYSCIFHCNPLKNRLMTKVKMIRHIKPV